MNMEKRNLNRVLSNRRLLPNKTGGGIGKIGINQEAKIPIVVEGRWELSSREAVDVFIETVERARDKAFGRENYSYGKKNEFEVDENCITRGGWKARVIWISRFPDLGLGGETSEWLWAIHKPNEIGETEPVAHNKMTGEVAIPNLRPFLSSWPPSYEGHPADLVGEWEEEKT